MVSIDLIPKPPIDNPLSRLSLNELYQRYGPMLYVKTSDNQLILEDISIVELGILKRYLVEVAKELILPANHQHKWPKILICVTELTQEDVGNLIASSHPTGMMTKIEQIIATLGSLLVGSDIIANNLDLLKNVFLRLSIGHNNIVSEIYLSKWSNTVYLPQIMDYLKDMHPNDGNNIAQALADPEVRDDIRDRENIVGVMMNDYLRRQKYDIYEPIPKLDKEQLEILRSIYHQLTDVRLLSHLMEIFLQYPVSVSSFVSFFGDKITGNKKILHPSKESLITGLQALLKEEQRKALPEDDNIIDSNDNNNTVGIDSNDNNHNDTIGIDSNNNNGTDNNITPDDCFLFPGGVAHFLLPNGVRSPNEVWSLLDYYTGCDISSFDLSHAYVTGSVIPGVFLASPILSEIDPKDFIDLYYPNKLYNVMITDPSIYNGVINGQYYAFDARLNEGRVKPEIVRTILPKLESTQGADLDIAVDAKLPAQEFEALAQSYWIIVRQRYPEATLSSEVKPGGGIIYNILGGHRPIQVYQSSLKQIMTHHVGMVRGFVTGNGDHRNFYLSASCLLSVIKKSSINYYYFAGKKSKPIDVINKYTKRGWFYDPELMGKMRFNVAGEDCHYNFTYRGLAPLDKYEVYLKYFKYIGTISTQRAREQKREFNVQDWMFEELSTDPINYNQFN